MDIFYFPRGRDSFPPKFHLIPPKNFFFPTWKIKILHVGISKYPRGESVSPDTAPYRYVVDSKFLQRPSVEFAQPGLTNHNRSVQELHISDKRGLDEFTIYNVSALYAKS